MSTKKLEVKFYADPDIEDWLATIPSGKRGAAINEMLRTAINANPSSTKAAVDLPTSKQLAEVLKRLDVLESEQADYKANGYANTVDELLNWKESFPDPMLFENIESADIEAALELLKELGADGIIEAVREIPELEERINTLETELLPPRKLKKSKK